MAEKKTKKTAAKKEIGDRGVPYESGLSKKIFGQRLCN